MAGAAHLNPHIQRILFAVSLANLCLLRVWDAVLYSKEADYLSSSALAVGDYLGALCAVAILAVAIFTVSMGTEHHSRWARVGSWVVLAALGLLPLDFLRRSLHFPQYVILIGGIVAALTAALVPRVRRMLVTMIMCVYYLWPYAVINSLTLAKRACGVDADSRTTAVPATGNEPPTRRVIWVIFDELDQTGVFDQRPAHITLPNIDRLVGQSAAFLDARPPSDETLLSIPSLLTGKMVVEAVPSGPDSLRVRFQASSDWTALDFEDTILGALAKSGRSSAIYGWYHPYSRLFPSVSSEGWGYPEYQGYRKGSIVGSGLGMIAAVLLPNYGRIEMAQTARSIHHHTLSAIRQGANELEVAHYNVPHLPGIYDISRRTYSSMVFGTRQGYYSNLVLVDDLLGEIVKEIDQSAVPTSLVVSSDHAWRTSPLAETARGRRVPLIIRPYGGGPARVYNGRFDTVNTRQLVERLIIGEIRNTEDVLQCASWIQRNSDEITSQVLQFPRTGY